MINNLMKELLRAGVPNRHIMKNWAKLGYIGSCLKEDVTCQVTYLEFDKGKIWVDWIAEANNGEARVRFDLTSEDIRHYINRHNLHITELNEKNTGLAVVWLWKARKALNV